MEILKNAYRIPVLNIDDTQGIVNILNSPEFQEIYSFYAQQIPANSVLNNLPDLEKKFGFYFQYTGQEEYLSQMEQILYCKHLPSIDEFLKLPEYMGNSWGITYPYWREKLRQIFAPGTRVFECLTGDTKIPLLNGTTKTIKELFESNIKGEYTYSWDQENYKFVPGAIERVVYNGKRRVYKITLDNGKSFKITGNHKILMRNNRWKRADQLSVGDSLMPFDKFIPSKTSKFLAGYEIINQPNKDFTSTPIYTHRMSAAWKYGRWYRGTEVVHHKNFLKENNNPTNLIYLDKTFHYFYHSRHAKEFLRINKHKIEKYWASDAGQRQKEIRRIRAKKFFTEYFNNETNKQNFRNLMKECMKDEKRRKQSSINISKFNLLVSSGDPLAKQKVIDNVKKGLNSRWSDKKQREIASQKMRELNRRGLASKASLLRWNKEGNEFEREKLRQTILKRNYENNPSKRDDISDEDIILALQSSFSAKEVTEKLKCSRSFLNNHALKMGVDWRKLLKQITKEDLIKTLKDSYTFAEAANKFNMNPRRFRVFTNKFNIDEKNYLKVNHKILSIEILNQEEDVYDICIMGPHHNFSLDAGCIVHNCIYRGAIGTGKTTIARRAAAYCIYRLCCLRNPHALFNIAPDTVISALMISVILEQADVTVFNPMLQMIRQTPCFKEVRKESSFAAFSPGDPVPFVKSGRKIIFPNNILLTVGSNINHVIGQSSAIVVMDEAEEKNPKDAFDLYTAMRGRIKSRFLDSSLTMCSLISSSKSKNGMVWEYIKKIPRDDPTVMMMEPPIWDVKSSVFDYNKGRFWVQVGTKTNPSIILPTDYDNIPEEKLTYVPPPGCRLISVPYEYRRDFENNLEKYLQDYGGITTDTSDRPFDDLSQLGSPGLLPEVHLEANVGDPVPLIDKLPQSLFVNTPNGRRLARYPGAPRYCFTGETKVKLLNGTSKNFIELTKDFHNNINNYVYSWDINKQKWCVGRISDVGITKYVKELVEVTLDNGEIVRCTPDHKFLLRNGEYKAVSDIKESDSILALYKIESINEGYKRKTYEQILNPITGCYDYTYRISSEFYKENYENAKQLAAKLGSHIVIHHKDLNASNNSPDNLIYLENNTHLSLHCTKENNHLLQLWKMPKFREMMREVSAKNGAINGYKNMTKNWESVDFRDKMKSISSNNGHKNIIKYNKSKERRLKISEMCKEGLIGVKKFSKEMLQKGNIECRRKIIIKNFEYLENLGLEFTKENWEANRYCKNVPRWNRLLQLNDDDFGDLKSRLIINHRIKNIKYIQLDKNIPVYDLTVENKENSHNFVLDAGIVVSNCHIDLASRDSAQAGYSMFHIEYILNENGEKIPVYVADFISWISAQTRIDHEAINTLALDLKNKAGVHIKVISYDQFQSEAIRQKLKQNKEFEQVLYQSVDRTNEAYWNFSQFMMKGRIKIGECPYLREQLSNIGLEDGKVLTTHKKDMADSCLAADTKVFLLSGKKVSVEELYRMDTSKEWILACDIQNRRLVPVKIERVIQKDFIPKTLYRFNLNNGESFSVTSDHLILKKNKEYCAAENIQVGDELMPFNYYHELNYHDRYRKVVNPFTGGAQFLYKLVSKSVMSDKIELAKKRAEQDGSKFTVIHHVNHNKNNDTPENLLPLTNIEHTNLHAMSGKEIQAFHDRAVFKRERSKIINSGLALMRRVNPEGYRRYIVEHDVETKLAEKKAKSENTRVYVESIDIVKNEDYVYDIVLDSIHNFALECGVFVHNCVGAVHNAEVYPPSSLEYAYYETEQQAESLSNILGFDKEEYDLEEI